MFIFPNLLDIAQALLIAIVLPFSLFKRLRRLLSSTFRSLRYYVTNQRIIVESDRGVKDVALETIDKVTLYRNRMVGLTDIDFSNADGETLVEFDNMKNAEDLQNTIVRLVQEKRRALQG
jgi:hypothetical protein